MNALLAFPNLPSAPKPKSRYIYCSIFFIATVLLPTTCPATAIISIVTDRFVVVAADSKSGTGNGDGPTSLDSCKIASAGNNAISTMSGMSVDPNNPNYAAMTARIVAEGKDPTESELNRAMEKWIEIATKLFNRAILLFPIDMREGVASGSEFSDELFFRIDKDGHPFVGDAAVQDPLCSNKIELGRFSSDSRLLRRQNLEFVVFQTDSPVLF
jgi:hypothetical protein